MSDKLRAAAQAALETLDCGGRNYSRAAHILRAALAEQEQEPVGYEHHEYRPYGALGEIRIHAVLKSQYLHPDGSIGGDFQYLIDSYKTEKTTIKLIPLYTAPPRREWVGLTQTQVKLLREGVHEESIKTGDSIDWVFYTHTNEALKEKNGG